MFSIFKKYKEDELAKVQLIFVYIMFATMGVYAKFIPLDSQVLVFYRCTIGALFISLALLFTKRKFDIKAVKKDFKVLLLAGLSLGIYWMFQFLTLDYIPLSVATVCYNVEPIVLIIISVFMFGEKLTLKSCLCILLAMVGIIFISGVVGDGKIGKDSILGIIYGLLTAIFYAYNVALTKKVKYVSSYEKSIIQFVIGALMMLPIILSQKMSFTFIHNDNFIRSFLCLVAICVINTGFVYILFFDVVSKVSSKTIAIYTYIDPALSLLFSYVIFNERLVGLQIVGVVLIMGAVLINEFVNVKKIKNNGPI